MRNETYTELAHRWDESDEAKDEIVAVEIDRLLETYGECRFAPLLKRLWLTLGQKPRVVERTGYHDGRYADWGPVVEILAELPENEFRWVTQSGPDQKTAMEVLRRLWDALLLRMPRESLLMLLGVIAVHEARIQELLDRHLLTRAQINRLEQVLRKQHIRALGR